MQGMEGYNAYVSSNNNNQSNGALVYSSSSISKSGGYPISISRSQSFPEPDVKITVAFICGNSPVALRVIKSIYLDDRFAKIKIIFYGYFFF